MRKISSKYDRKRKEKRNQWIIGGILIFLMFASTLGFALNGSFGNSDSNSEQINSYNGYAFEQVNNFWVLGNLVFAYHPSEVSDMENVGNTELKDFESYSNETLYIYSDVAQAESEIRVNLGQIALNVENACPENAESCSEFPTKTCNDKFIILKEGNTNEIKQEENCVYVTGSSAGNLVRNTDELLFKIFGIK